MDQLWSPWRSQYIDSLTDTNNKQNSGCFLCDAMHNPDKDEENLVVARREHCFVIMNRYPYNSGHILIVPMQHTGDMAALSGNHLACIMNTIRESTVIMQELFSPDGLNIGANIGRAAGAGLPDHIHFHVLPRWNGDTNFMATFADIKVVSSSMEETRSKLTAAFAR